MGISIWEFLLIVVVIIVVLGPNKIPGIMRTLGIVVRNLRKITSELTANVAREMALDDTPQETRKRTPARPTARTAEPLEITPPRILTRQRTPAARTADIPEVDPPGKPVHTRTAAASRTKHDGD